VYGDVHEEAHSTDLVAVKKHMDYRASLPNPHFIGLGDMGDWIMPNDLKRYMPSVKKYDSRTVGFDAIIDKELQKQVAEWKKYPWEFIAMGNHEFNVLKRHYTNPAERLCQMLETRYGGYCGFACIRFCPKADPRPRHRLTFLYHHGAWGGRVVKGFGGARDWARAWDGWDVCLYGHNHQCVVHLERNGYPNPKGKLVKRNKFFINCGTWLDTYIQGGTPSYGEIRGYPPAAIASPLITVRLTKRNMDLTVSIGDQ